MSQPLRWLLIAGSALLLGSATSEATKCPYARYVVEGRLVAPSSIEPGGVRIYLFLEGAQLTSDYPPGPDEREYVVPDPEGFFKVEARLNTEESGRCKHFVESGQLFVIGDEHRAFRKGVTFPNAKRSIREALEVKAEGVRVHLAPRPILSEPQCW